MIKHFSLFFCIFVLISFNLQAEETFAVKVKPFADIAQSRTYEYPAQVVNLQIADIAAETQGRIIDFPIQVGDPVNQGQVLVRLDCSRARIDQNRILAGLKRLRAKKQLTQQQLDRAKGLESSRSISRDELDQRQTQLDADNASIEEQLALLESAKKSVADCSITAPFSGVVIDKLSARGAYANPGSPVLRLMQQDAVELELELPIEQVNNLQQAQRIEFISNEDDYDVTIRSILPVVNGQSLQQKVRLNFTLVTTPPGGSFGIVRYATAKTYLPDTHVYQRNGKFGVFLAQQNRAKFVVLPSAQEGQAANTRLAPDDRVIVSGAKRLRDNDPISIAE